MLRSEYLRLMQFPDEWESWGMIPEDWISGAIDSYKPGMENASERDRHGVFQWWLKNHPSDSQLLKLVKLSNIDPDQHMGGPVRAGIADIIKKRFRGLLDYGSVDATSASSPLNWRSPEGDTCLHYAAMRGDEVAIQILIELGVDPNVRGDMGRTPLHCAVSSGHEAAVQALVSYGADESVRDEFGNLAATE